MRSLPDKSIHDQQWESNPRHSDLKSNGLSIWPQAPIEIITSKWEGIRDVGSARYELALLPPYPTIRHTLGILYIKNFFLLKCSHIIKDK